MATSLAPTLSPHSRENGIRSESPQSTFVDYFRCPTELARFGVAPDLSADAGHFVFAGRRCFGRASRVTPTRGDASLPNAGDETLASPDGPLLPFDLSEVVTNLRRERYHPHGAAARGGNRTAMIADRIYYWIRPVLSVNVRKHLQRFRLRGWKQLAFPDWPVDATVDELMRHTMGVVVRSSSLARLPFIWFWPEGHASCTTLTHDVEGQGGLEFFETLMDIDDQHGLKASYQLIPERSEDAWQRAASIRDRGCEVNLHDLNHDGLLYRDKASFLERAKRINALVKQYGCSGFRAGAMYREQDWYEAFDFEFDMSVPSVAHLEPQRGGCCTVMPYFVGDILELPLTTTQDYSLFFILNDFSTGLWEEQIARILEQNGLISVITHPDYLVTERARKVYTQLLARLAELRDRRQTWVALPGEINRWWRQRRAMTLSRVAGAWRIDGPGSERARVAYASVENGRVVYSLE